MQVRTVLVGIADRRITRRGIRRPIVVDVEHAGRLAFVRDTVLVAVGAGSVLYIAFIGDAVFVTVFALVGKTVFVAVAARACGDFVLVQDAVVVAIRVDRFIRAHVDATARNSRLPVDVQRAG